MTQTPAPGGIKGVPGLILGILGCLALIFIVGPAMDTVKTVQPLIRFIDERDIDAAALYYTEIEEFSIANLHMDNARAFPPQGPR